MELRPRAFAAPRLRGRVSARVVTVMLGTVALALGARAVLLGRPYVWGLAVGGEDGVRQVLRSLLAELDLTMALSGLTELGQLDAEVLTRP